MALTPCHAIASSRPGRLGAVKEHALNPSDRAAPQGLIPLAGALGAGPIFALFFGGRKRGSGTAVFELFAIAAVLAAVGMTAFLAISLLHRNEAIGDKDLTQTATPLIFAVFLLVFVSVLGRLPGSVERFFALLPLLLAAGVIAAWLASSSWSFEPADAVLFALLTICCGGVAAFVAWGSDRLYGRWDRETERKRFVRLSGAGYRVEERELRAALPSGKRGVHDPTVSCWTRKDRTYVDRSGCRQLRDATNARWDRLAAGRGRPPLGPAVLAKVYVPSDVAWLAKRRIARLWLFEPGADEEIRLHELKANDDGLLDVTEVGLL
jgi:hypothetical protein